MKCCTFTGHRYQSFPWGHDETDARFLALRSHLTQAIRQSLAEGYTHFITGGATGVDTWAAEILLELKNAGQALHLEIAVPFPTHHATLKGPWKARTERVLAAADRVTVVSLHLPPKIAFHARNDYMLRHAERLIAVYDSRSSLRGGTYSTLCKAKKAELDIIEIPWMSLIPPQI